MAGKQILGDDPFASDEPAMPPPQAGDAAAQVTPAKTTAVASDAAPAEKAPKSGKKGKGKAAKTSAATATSEAAAPVVETAVEEAIDVKADADAASAIVAEVAEMLVANEVATSAPESIAEATAESIAEATADLVATSGDAAKTNGSAKLDAPVETYSTLADKAPPSEYGPSIDRPPATGYRHGLVEEARHIEKSVRERLLPQRTGEHGGERQRLPLEFVWQRWRRLAMRDRSEVVDEFGRDPHVAARVEPMLDFLYKSYFRVETRGLGHIPDDGRGLIVANHSGTLPYDGAMIMHAVRTEHRTQREVRPLVEDFVFHFPYLGTLMNRIGGVRACPENAERLLHQDQLVAVFPEGIKGIGKLYKERYQLQRFGRGGFIKLALKSDAPIIPTAVVGAEEIHPMLTKVTWLAKSVGIPYIPVTPTFPMLGVLGLIPLPTKWFIAFGEPLYFNAEYGAEGANDRILVNKLAEQVRVRIQDMIDGLLKTRKSILFG
ncbi:MAG TPA: 1-acyl-sn-glycerol-3-phosphate acyltransferase [Polyangia bacterium]|nr:1-acyl-sn-glycerol-3-phosphate acyltransferase [Polyangia bacterium]